MKRKIFISIIFSVLCVFSALGLFACGNDKIEITQDYVIECLEKIPNIVDIESATEYNDPNGQLNKDGGYIAHVYFSVDVINQDEITGVTLVDKGTDAGGSIEVYRNSEDAERRNTYLSSFDGTVLSSGSHKVYETCIIRTSDELTASQQNILENNIIKALSKSTESFVSMDTYLIQVAKELAEKDNLSAVETAIKLVELGYPTAKVEQVIADSNIDWGKIASKKAEGFADYYATVYPVMITDLLLDNGFTDEEIEYAIENANIDWQYYAKIHAKSFINSYEGKYLCPNDILGHLSLDKGYTVPDCEVALASCDVNWNNKAVEYIEYIDSEGEYATKSMYIDDLLSVEFTTAQVKYAVDNCGKNWNNKALSNLDYFVNTLSATPPNKTQCITQLKNWGFYDSEIEYAINNFDGIIYPDKLNYTVTLNPNEGELSIRTLNVIFGKSVTLPTPTRSGYSFVGWYNGQTKVESGVWYIAENVTLTATWEQTKFAISYNLDGGKNHSDNPAFYTINDSVTLKEPTKTGNDFIGWTFTGQTTPIKNVSISVGTKGEKNYTANWSPKTYTVTYDATGGTPAKNSEQVVFGSYFKPTTATKTGYDFNGWFYNGNEEYSNDYYNIASDITLSARWNNKGFWINYNANGGEVVSVQQRVFYDKTYEMYDTTRVGYKFLGWYNGTTKIENGTWKRLSDLNVTASWQALSYTISYNPDNGSSLESDTVFYDEYITLPTPTREGYTFSGWYNNGKKYTSGKWTTAKNIELEAYWTANSNTPYIVNHYQQNIENDDYALYNTQNLTGTTDAYVWPSVKSYTGFTSPSSKRAKILPNGSLIVDYYYTRNSYTISFVSNGGNSIDNITQKYQSNLNLLEGKRTNFTFGGWFEDKDLSNEFSLATMPATNKTLYAWWSEENKPTDFVYSGTLEISIDSYVGESTTMCIPAYIEGIAVTQISKLAFEDKNIITKAIVPNTVISIGEGAFNGCSSIYEISIPFVGKSETATSNNNTVFGYIFGLVKTSGVSTTRGKTSEANTTHQCDESSYSYGFAIPKSIRIVTITKQTAIPNNAFYNCDLIEEINIPNNTISVGTYAFYNCTNVVGYNMDANNKSILPESLAEINDYTFANNSSLQKIILSSQVATIGQYAFVSCLNLLSVESNGGSMLSSIGNYAFNKCSKLESFATSQNVSNLKTIGKYAFGGCVKISQYFNGTTGEMILPNGITKIGEYAFHNNSIITKIVVPESITTINIGTFKGCNSLEDITLPFVGKNESITENSQKVFGVIFDYETSSSTEIQPKDLVMQYSVDAAAASYAVYYNYYIPKTIKKVTITKQVNIPARAFMNCDVIENIELPNNIVSIGLYAFYKCSSLTNIYIPESVVEIGSDAFKNCSSLTICCQALEQPTGWNSKWNSSNCTVCWNKNKL